MSLISFSSYGEVVTCKSLVILEANLAQLPRAKESSKTIVIWADREVGDDGQMRERNGSEMDARERPKRRMLLDARRFGMLDGDGCQLRGRMLAQIGGRRWYCRVEGNERVRKRGRVARRRRIG